MPFNLHTCVSVTCDECAEGWGEDFTVHFASEAEALSELRRDGWLVMGNKLRCPSCALHADCLATGHRHGDWEPREMHGVTFRVRFCEHCGEMNTDPSRDQLTNLWRLAAMVNEIDVREGGPI
ncbi:hypothetical protein [Actinoplanes aureus]|uniref:Uncharacterized protein n=1 Tax=Actinoplanes aureus TaxID=2792083 RepID=A0A931G1M8_9ACTN|nr:hypothetical protein [Actinoplanes aureus]MBG0568078.1 hypothetical protein [Actinoplanes aureus]